jgi:tetratricopeptide (TPR) repeat protein
MSISWTSRHDGANRSKVLSRHGTARLAMLAAAMGLWSAMSMTAAHATENAATAELRSKAVHAEATGHHKEAQRYYTMAVEQDPGDPESWKRLGDWQEGRTLWKAAIVSYGKMLAAATVKADKKVIMDAAERLGRVHYRMRDLPRAEEAYRKALAAAEKNGEQFQIAQQYGNLGYIHYLRGDLATAEAEYHKARDIYIARNARESLAYNYSDLGWLHRKKGDRAAACEHWRQSRALWKQIGHCARLEEVEKALRKAGCEAPRKEASSRSGSCS